MTGESDSGPVGPFRAFRDLKAEKGVLNLREPLEKPFWKKIINAKILTPSLVQQDLGSRVEYTGFAYNFRYKTESR